VESLNTIYVILLSYRFVKWMFGFEPEDDAYHRWWKWEARQRTLRILKTKDKQSTSGEDYEDSVDGNIDGNESNKYTGYK